MAKIGSIIEKQRNEGVNSKHAQAKKEKQEAAKAQAATHKSTITKLEAPKLEPTATEEPNIFQRALDTLTSAAKGTASQGTELGGLALTGLANLNKKKSAAADAYYQARESADRYLDLMNNAQTDKERNEWKSLAERYIKQAEYFKGEIEKATEFKTVQSGANKVYETADKLGDSAAADLERAKQGLGTGGKLAVDFASTAAQWAGDAALGAVTGTGMLPMMLRAAGGGAQQARANGADAGQQAVYALGSGVLAGATERIANVASPLKKVFGKGILDDAIQKAAGKMTQNAAGRMALSFISEGGEEMLESAVQPILQNITYDAGAEYDSEWLADTLYQGLMGGLLGGVLGGAGEIGTAAQTRKTQKTTGAQMNALGDDMVRAIIDSGLETDQKSKSYKLAQAADKKVKAGKKLSDKELGALFLETDREYQAKTEKEQKPAEDEEPEESGIVLPTDTQEEEGIVLPTAEAETGSGAVLPETAARNTRNSEMNTQDAAVKGLEQTAARYGVDEKTTARVRRISDAVKRNVEFYQDEDAAQNGYYDQSTGTIYVNVNSKNPVAQIIGHELTHSIEESGEYGKLQELVFDELERKGNDLEQLRQKKKEIYARHGVELGDQTVIDSEIVAEYMEKNLLTNEESILELVRKDRTLAEKIMDQIDKILAALGNEDAQARVFLSKAKRIYSTALNETTQKSQETQKPQAEQETEEAQQEPEGKRKSRKQQKEEEERRQKERRAERVEEKVRGTTMDKEELAAAYAAGEITEEEFDRAMESIISDENEIGEDLLKGPEKYSFGGENARRADLDALRQAKEMERQGVAMQTIFRETGWFTGADGKWRFEIDDSGERYDPRNQEGAVPGQTLADFLQHDELFKNYPQLRKTQVRFEDLGRGLLGSYSRSTDTITLNESLRDAPEDVLVHEIQHAVQMAEGFAQGANEKFWSRQIESGYDSRTEAQRREAKRLWNEFYKIRDEEPEFFSDMMDLAAIEPTVPRGRVNWETLEQIEEDPPEWKRYDQMRDSLEEKYGDTRVWDFQDLRYKIKQAELNNGRTAAELYYDTAGEIEARDAAARRTLSAEERRNRMPDTGNEDTVFVETELGDSLYSISEDNAGKELTQQQREFFQDSKARNAAGELLVLYHQTGNDFTIFDTRHEGAGTSDNETPFGIFMKPTDENIGLRGGKQMELYANIKNPLVVEERGDLIWRGRRMSDGYDQAMKEIERTDAEYEQKTDEMRLAIREYMMKWRSENPGASRVALYDDATYKEMSEQEDRLLDEWESTGRQLAKKAKEELTNALKENGYDGVFLKNDRGSFGRVVSAYIALDPEQVKLTSNTAPTEDPDIRFSIGYDSDWRTLSEDQKRYFENSVVRDESGRLMVLYHGSTSPLFTEFNTENGVWMTPEESYARAYADVYDSPYTDTAALTGMESDIYMPLQRQRMYEVYADLRNVVELGEINGNLNEGKLGEIAAAAGIDAGELLDIAEPYMGGSVFEMTRSKDFLDLMRNAGFDGMYAEEDGVPTFCAIGSPEQVKLTSNKNPSQNPDIRYSVEETPEQENDRRTAVDTEQAGAYDGNRMTAAQGGLYNGPGAQRNDGDALSAQVRRPETVDAGVRGRGIQTNGRIQEEQGQRAGVPRWARGRLIDGTDRQGGFDDGQDEYELRGVHGEDVWRREADGTDPGRAGRSGPSDARGGAADERRRSAAPATWARGRIIDKPSADAGIAAENAARYGANVFVVEDAAIKEQNPTAWALTSGGNIYISDKIPAELADVVGFHEAVHAAKQRRDTQYLNLLEDTGEHIDFGSNQAQKVLGVILKRRFSGKDLADISQDQMNTIFDELNALVWGFHKADPENARAQFAGMFRDYESYISELDAAMESNTDSAWRDPGMLPTAETGQNETAGPDIRYSVEDQETDAQEQEAQEQETQEPAADVVSMLPKKAQGYLAAAERKMVNAIGNAMNVPYRARRDFLQTITREISAEYLTDGKISEETMNNLFERAYEEGRVVDEEFYTQYKDLKDYLRTVPVTISQEDAADIADYNDFRKSTFGRLRIVNEGGTPVDVVYEELRNMARELFPGNLTHPADQLMRMFDVAKSIQRSEKNLDEFYGENAGEFKRWAKNEFETAVSNTLSSLRNVKRYAEDQARESSFEPTNLTQEQVMELYKDLKKRRKDQEKAQAKNLLTKDDEKRVNELMRGLISLESLDPEKNNVAGIKAVYEAKQAYEEVAKKLRDWNAERRGILNDQADKLLETANDWNDKRAGILYSRETMERNIRDIVPDEDLANEIIKTYFTPVHKAAADANRLKNRMREKVREMNLSQKVAEGNTVSEAHAVQLIGEARDNIQVLENSRGRTKTRDGKTLEDWKAVVSDLWEENPNLDKRKIENAVGEFRKIYDELFQQMNEARVRNGYEPINYRRGYFPHFQPGNTDGILDAFGRALGISTEVTALPTTINGLTHTFKPGIRYMGNALERLGFNTAYDAVEGFDRYIEGAADVIYQTDNIQRLRALARQTRYRTGDEGIRKQVDAVLADPRLTETEKTDKIDKIYETARFALSNFVVELDEYTNLLANKKSRYDRSMEYQAGRGAYNAMKALSSRVAANMVAVNPASWLTNFIPLTQGGAMVGYRELLPAMWGTLQSYKENDGFVDRSAFLTNRRGSDPLVRSWSQNMSAVASAPMTWIDSFVADSLVRARYSQNLKNGLSEQASMDEADEWVAGVMADRSKGSTPTLFQRNNPLTKLFTQFQLEVNNQLSYVAKDMPREYKKDGMKVLAAALLRFALGAFLFNELYEFFIGRRPALDPIGILNDTAGDLTGYELPNLVELGTGVLTGDAPDFRTERVNGYEAVANLTGNILESTPFVGSLLGGGRLPISNALPDAANLSKGLFNGEMPMNKRISTVAKELGNPLTYVALPFGGGQLKKVFQGVKAVVQGGRYSLDSEGNKILQYPVYNDSVTDVAGNLLTGTLFGVTATEGGKEWIENEFKSLNAAQTETYLAMQELGVDGRTAFDLITSIRDAEKTETTSKAQEQRKVLMNADAPGIAKGAAYYGLMASDSEKVLMDVLDDTGADLGEVASVFVKMKDADLLSGAAASNAKRDALKNSTLTDDEKIVIYKTKISDTRDEDISEFQKAGIPFDTFLEAQNEYSTINEEYDGASKKAVEFSRWVNQQNLTDEQAAAVRKAFPLSGGSYDKLVGTGLDDETAYQVSSALEGLEPEDGEDSVSKIQQYKAVTESGLSTEDQVQALSAVMTETEYERLLIGYDAGVTPESYVRFKEMLPEYDADGNGRYRKEEVEAAVRAIPGLSNAQRAALWQIQNKSWKPTGNPFSTSAGQKVYNDLQGAASMLPTETETGGGIMLPMG